MTDQPTSDPRFGNWAVTTTDDCYGQPPGTTPDSWCVFDADEDDPPIADRMTRPDAEMVCRALHIAADDDLNVAWGVRWQQQFDRAEKAEADLAAALESATIAVGARTEAEADLGQLRRAARAAADYLADHTTHCTLGSDPEGAHHILDALQAALADDTTETTS